MGLLVLVALFPRSGPAREYTSPEVVLSVVDESGRPITGAIGLVTWAVTRPHYSEVIGIANIFEGVTDDDGKVIIPSWSKRLSSGEIPADQPIVRVFKAGHMPIVVLNQAVRPGRGSVLWVDWGHEPLTLLPVEPPASGAWTYQDRYVRKLGLVISTMLFYGLDRTCLIDRIHLLRDAVNGELDRILLDDRVGIRVGENRSGCAQ